MAGSNIANVLIILLATSEVVHIYIAVISLTSQERGLHNALKDIGIVFSIVLYSVYSEVFNRKADERGFNLEIIL